MLRRPPPSSSQNPSQTQEAARKVSPRELISLGMSLFRQGKVSESADVFDRVLDVDSKYEPYLWQRGLSLYYAERFEEGAAQFRRDVAVNPSDTEEAIWAFMCEAQLPQPPQANKGVAAASSEQTAQPSDRTAFEAARRGMLVLTQEDRRPYMRVAYDLFRGTASEQALAEVGHAAGSGSAADFYSQLYLGLYNEALAEGGGVSLDGVTGSSGSVPAASYRFKARAYLKGAESFSIRRCLQGLHVEPRESARATTRLVAPCCVGCCLDCY
mmetsp:Transcript_47924/g.95034  ORF Transcript_47924/g.95034 Transcript_47924/m.95034 type:complete len:270 (+) Transcript_47924:121-930(+)